MKLKIKKVSMVNPTTRVKGFAARVVTNGTYDYDDIVAQATRNTTLHRSEAKVALEMCMEIVSEMLKQGYIVDLGPIGKLYPSCSSGWYAKAEDMLLADVKPSVYYHPSDELASAVRGATLRWAKDSDNAEDEDADTESGSGSSGGDGGNSGNGSGSGSGSGSGDDSIG